MLEVGRVVSTMAASALEDGIVGGIGVAIGADSVRIAVVEREERVITWGQSGRNPRGCCVTRDARGGPSCRHVIRIRGPREVCLMAGIAIGGRAREHAVHVALDAIHTDVRAGERERRVVVIEGRSGPGGCRMAGIARGRESRGGVIRICGSVPIGLVTAVAVRGKRREVIVRVTLRAGQGGMSSRERKDRCVVERRRAPTARRMANRTIGWETRSDMIGIRSSREVCLVATVAGRGR